jgi:predicted nucleic-acid-binding Zn-ribbon protein
MRCPKCGTQKMNLVFSGELDVTTETSYPQPLGYPAISVIRATCSKCGCDLYPKLINETDDLEDRLNAVLKFKLDLLSMMNSRSEKVWYPELS